MPRRSLRVFGIPKVVRLAVYTASKSAKSEPVSITRIKIPSAPKASIGFLEKRKNLEMKGGLIALRKDVYVQGGQP